MQKSLKLLTQRCGEYYKLLREVDIVSIEVMRQYIEGMHMMNMFRKRKYCQPIVIERVKIKPINDEFYLIFTTGLTKELDKTINGFIDSCQIIPDRKEEYRVLDYVRVNNSALYGVVSPDVFFIDRNYKETDIKLTDTVDVAGDLILDLRFGGAIKALFLVRAIKESL